MVDIEVIRGPLFSIPAFLAALSDEGGSGPGAAVGRVPVRGLLASGRFRARVELLKLLKPLGGAPRFFATALSSASGRLSTGA